jgi:hypothetical protein
MISLDSKFQVCAYFYSYMQDECVVLLILIKMFKLGDFSRGIRCNNDWMAIQLFRLFKAGLAQTLG